MQPSASTSPCADAPYWFDCEVVVTGMPTSDEDTGIPGRYAFQVHLTRSLNLEAPSPQEQWEIARCVLDEFHNRIGIDFLDDFNIEVHLPGGLVIHEEESIDTGLVDGVSYLG
jgi:hypothetical protein